MKMVSAAKYAKAERELRPARSFGKGAQAFYQNVDLTAEHAKKPAHLMILLTSDRGLCGAVHSNITRMIKQEMSVKPDDLNYNIVCVGDKSKMLLQRFYPKSFIMCCNEIGRKPPTFEDASKLAQAILTMDYKFDQGDIYYNQFKSAVSYKTLKFPIFSPDIVAASDKLTTYDSLDSDILKSYLEFSLTNLLYFGMKESACSEQSSRMTAMDSASKNAGEMIQKLTQYFNRTRQAVITRELIDIVIGASAL